MVTLLKGLQNSNYIRYEAYDNAQNYLSNQIKQPKDLNDLKRNADIKQRQVKLARAQGDLELASILAYEHQSIIQDINTYYK